MDFEFSDEQRQLGDTTRRLLSDCASSEQMRRGLADAPDSYDRALWSRFAEMGFLGINIPEEFGGLGLGALELCVVAAEVGAFLPRIPWSSNAYFCADMLAQTGSQELKQRWLPAIASGEAVGAFAKAPVLDVAGDRITAVLPAVPDGGYADFLIVATADRAWLVETACPGIVRTPVKTIDLLRPSVRVELQSAPARRLAGANAHTIAAVRSRAAVPIAFEQIGGAERMLAMAVEYAGVRKAFGQQIGAFQAVKALAADMFVAATLARSNAYHAAWAMAEEPERLPKAAALARLSATNAYRLCASSAIQIHGGLGFTWEIDCHFHYRRAHTLALLLGGLRPWQDQLVEAMKAERNMRLKDCA